MTLCLSLNLFQRVHMQICTRLREAAEDDALEREFRERVMHRLHHERRGALSRKTVNAGRDRRKRDGLELMFRRDLESAAIARGEFRVFVAMSAAPARTNCMDDMARRQLVAAGDLRIAGFAAAQCFTLAQQLLPVGAMDRAIDTAAAEQAFVGGIDDRIDIELGDVAERDL